MGLGQGTERKHKDFRQVNLTRQRTKSSQLSSCRKVLVVV